MWKHFSCRLSGPTCVLPPWCADNNASNACCTNKNTCVINHELAFNKRAFSVRIDGRSQWNRFQLSKQCNGATGLCNEAQHQDFVQHVGMHRCMNFPGFFNLALICHWRGGRAFPGFAFCLRQITAQFRRPAQFTISLTSDCPSAEAQPFNCIICNFYASQ